MKQDLPAPLTEREIILQKYNQKKLKAQAKLQKYSLGKGKIAKVFDSILIGGAAVLEVIRELPGFEYLKSMSIGNLTTKFNTWLATIFTKTPDLTGMTPEQIWEAAQQAQANGTNQMANSWGLIFSSILEFVVQHPTVAAVGVAALTGVLLIPFKALVKKLKAKKVKKLAEEEVEELQRLSEEEQQLHSEGRTMRM
jgi:hypothetical protein